MKAYTPVLERISKVLDLAVEQSALKNVLEDLLTPAEILDIDERVKIFKGLIKGDSQRKVAADLGVSVAKVTRGAHALKYGANGIVKLLDTGL